jgi:hypothetical protein
MIMILLMILSCNKAAPKIMSRIRRMSRRKRLAGVPIPKTPLGTPAP